jgi:phosphoribosylformimino-5-aminoimidazole carboxamide ribotide isomerase
MHVVDLDAAKGELGANSVLIEELARKNSVRLQAGGGVRNPDAIERLLSAGVERVVIGSAAAQRPREVSGWLRSFGAEHVCLAFDVRISGTDEPPRVHTDAWAVPSAASLWEALEAYPPGTLGHVLCTDIGRDGTLDGPNLSLYAMARERFPLLSWQASGGIRRGSDLTDLAQLGVAAAVSGRALLESRIALAELRPFLRAA